MTKWVHVAAVVYKNFLVEVEDDATHGDCFDIVCDHNVFDDLEDMEIVDTYDVKPLNDCSYGEVIPLEDAHD